MRYRKGMETARECRRGALIEKEEASSFSAKRLSPWNSFHKFKRWDVIILLLPRRFLFRLPFIFLAHLIGRFRVYVGGNNRAIEAK